MQGLKYNGLPSRSHTILTYTHLVSLALKLTEKNKAGGCVVSIHGRTLDARRSEWCATLRVNHCILIHAHPLTMCCFSIT